MPQGSILGPILFSVYNYDLPRYSEYDSKIAIFADDTSIVKAGTQSQCNLQTDLDRINNLFFSFNKLSLNIPKCEVMKFEIAITKDLTLPNEKLPEWSASNYLGVLFHDLLSMSSKN